MTLKVFREEGGLRGLYRGIGPTAAGVAPYVGLNFVRAAVLHLEKDHAHRPCFARTDLLRSLQRLLHSSGSACNGSAQTFMWSSCWRNLTDPHISIRRTAAENAGHWHEGQSRFRLQEWGRSKVAQYRPVQLTVLHLLDSFDAIRTIVEREGLRGLYTGLCEDIDPPSHFMQWLTLFNIVTQTSTYSRCHPRWASAF